MEKKYIALLSGGRDSTAMVEMLLSNGDPLDHIIFANTQHEFPQMYDYIDRFDRYIQDKYGMSITILQPSSTFEDWCFGRVISGNRKGMVRGIPMITVPCYWKREAKVRPIERFIKKELSGYDVVKYVGYTYSEKKRSNVKDPNVDFPLIRYKMCEADVDRLLREINMENPLYYHFERTGCSFCPYMKRRSYYILWKHYPEEFNYMLEIENKLKSMDDVVNDQWMITESLEEFAEQCRSGKVTFRDEAPISCECKLTLFD